MTESGEFAAEKSVSGGRGTDTEGSSRPRWFPGPTPRVRNELGAKGWVIGPGRESGESEGFDPVASSGGYIIERAYCRATVLGRHRCIDGRVQPEREERDRRSKRRDAMKDGDEGKQREGVGVESTTSREKRVEGNRSRETG